MHDNDEFPPSCVQFFFPPQEDELDIRRKTSNLSSQLKERVFFVVVLALGVIMHVDVPLFFLGVCRGRQEDSK